MLEVGVDKQASGCGADGKELCTPLTARDAQTHFGAWCIVSAPLTLSLDLKNASAVDASWPLISNSEAIEVDQDWLGGFQRLTVQAE